MRLTLNTRVDTNRQLRTIKVEKAAFSSIGFKTNIISSRTS